jgi:hypothetical protein
MSDDQQVAVEAGLEEAFAGAEASAEAALKAANAVAAAVKAYRSAAQQGKVRELMASAEKARASIATLDQEIANLAESWEFDEESYLANGAFTRELIATAGQAGLRIDELDNRLYCYPALIRVLPGDRAVLIDKTRERRIRPSVLVAHLRDMQRKPPRFRSGDFLEALYSAYQIAIQRKRDRGEGAVVPLLELYELFTLAPGQSREYSRQEFARDVYLLDQSGQDTTKDGSRVEFHAGAGARIPRGALTVVTMQGAERKYHGVSFSRSGGT